MSAIQNPTAVIRPMRPDEYETDLELIREVADRMQKTAGPCPECFSLEWWLSIQIPCLKQMGVPSDEWHIVLRPLYEEGIRNMLEEPLELRPPYRPVGTR